MFAHDERGSQKVSLGDKIQFVLLINIGNLFSCRKPSWSLLSKLYSQAFFCF